MLLTVGLAARQAKKAAEAEIEKVKQDAAVATAAAMVAESDGLVVPAGRRGATFSVWRSFFGGGGGGDANTARDKDICQNDDAEGRGTRVHDGPDSRDAADDRAALLSSWGKRR